MASNQFISYSLDNGPVPEEKSTARKNYLVSRQKHGETLFVNSSILRHGGRSRKSVRQASGMTSLALNNAKPQAKHPASSSSAQLSDLEFYSLDNSLVSEDKSTRRKNYLVSRQKHGETLFVNSYIGERESRPQKTARHVSGSGLLVPNKAKHLASSSLVQLSDPEKGNTTTSTRNQLHRSLDRNSLYGLPDGFSTSQKRGLFSYLELFSRGVYFFEALGVLSYNPLRTGTAYESVVNDSRSLRCATYIGYTWELTSEILHVNSTTMANHFMQCCSVINRVISEVHASPHSDTFEMIIQAVSSIAQLCFKAGYYDEWHVHMKGLMDLVRTVGMDSLSMTTQWSIHRVDMFVAGRLYTQPFFPIERPSNWIFDYIDEETYLETENTLRGSLGACCKEEPTFQMFMASFLFKYAAFLGTTQGRVEPDALMATWYYISHLILMSPRPVRDIDTSDVESFKQSIRDPSSPILSGSVRRDLCDCIQCLLRVSITLYYRNGLLSHDKEEHSNPILLRTQKHYLQVVLHRIRNGDAGLRINSATQSASSAKKLAIATRPALIWTVISAKLNSMLGRSNGVSEEFLGDDDLFCGLITELVGSHPADVDGLADSEFEFSRLMKLRFSTEKNWCMKAVMKQLLVERSKTVGSEM